MSRRVLDHVPEGWNGLCPDCGAAAMLHSPAEAPSVWCTCQRRKPGERSRNPAVDFGERLLAKLKSRKVWDGGYYATDTDRARHAAVTEVLDAIASDIEEVLTAMKAGT